MTFRDDVVPAARVRAFERLIAGATHEANNALTTIQGLSALLSSSAADPDSAEDLEILVAESRRAITILRTLRAFAGRSDSETQACSLNDSVGLVANARRYECQAHGISLEVQLDPDLLLVVAEPTRLMHMVLLPVLQAEDALAAVADEDEDVPASSADARRIVIATSPSPESVTLTVTASGGAAQSAGLRQAAADLPDLLEACRSEVAALGGDLRFESGPAHNTVTIVLPAVA